MLSENVASNSLQVTVEGIKVAGKLSEETLKMLKNLLKSTGHLAIGSVKLGVAVGDKVKKNNLLNRSGEQTLLKFIKENEPLNDTILNSKLLDGRIATLFDVKNRHILNNI